MSDDAAATPPKKKGKGKLILFIGLPLLLAGAGGGGYFAYASGMLSAAPASAAESGPKLVDKADEKRAGSAGSEGGHGESGSSEAGHGGLPTPKGEGGDKYASTYYQFEKEFTSNLADSVHFIQVGIAISTPYDDTVIESIKTHEIAIRSAILMALGQTSEEEVFTAEGKAKMQKRLVDAVNAVLKEKQGFGGVSNVYFTTFIVQ